MRSFLAALQFLTVIPIRAQLEEGDFESSPFWFAQVGLLIGASVALVDALLARTCCSGLLRSILTIGLLAALSGGMHLDGLADTADGFLSARSRERVLEIMRDSRIGTMGVLALVFVLAIKVAALAQLNGPTRWKMLLLAPLAGRALQVINMSLLPYARKQSGGKAAMFIRRNQGRFSIWSGLWLLSVDGTLFGFMTGAKYLVVIVIIATWLAVWSLRRIGGFTGDTLGATSEIVEVSSLLFACTA
jgi:adenosylcobinamide-GDP ribazoletransferase